MLKGFIDRTFLPGFAYKFEKKSKQPMPLPKRFLLGKTSHVIVTMDSSPSYMKYLLGNPVGNVMGIYTLFFCGIKCKKMTYIGPVRTKGKVYRNKWLEKVYKMGKKTI